MRWIERAWFNVEKNTIINCFNHSGMSCNDRNEDAIIQNIEGMQESLLQLDIFSNLNEVKEFLLEDENKDLMEFHTIESRLDIIEASEEYNIINVISVEKEIKHEDALLSFKNLYNYLSQKDFYGKMVIKDNLMIIENILEEEVFKSNKIQKSLVDSGFIKITKI